MLSLLRLDCFEAKSNVINDTCAIHVQLLFQSVHNLLPNLQRSPAPVPADRQHVHFD